MVLPPHPRLGNPERHHRRHPLAEQAQPPWNLPCRATHPDLRNGSHGAESMETALLYLREEQGLRC